MREKLRGSEGRGHCPAGDKMALALRAPLPADTGVKSSHPSIPEASRIFPACTQDGFLCFACLLSFDSAVQRKQGVLMFWMKNVLSG